MESPDLDVSRETLEKLQSFADLVQKWTAKINLISKPSIPHIWERHVLDSAQLYKAAPSHQSWVDIGSGGGFPGVIVSIMAQEQRSDVRTILVESDVRKSVFLRTAIRDLGLNAVVISERIEDVKPLNADILSARALADLNILLEFCERHLAPAGTALLMKGAQWKKEHEAAQTRWSYDCDVIRSVTNSDAAVLKIKDIQRV